jgi:hypothetical protein
MESASTHQPIIAPYHTFACVQRRFPLPPRRGRQPHRPIQQPPLLRTEKSSAQAYARFAITADRAKICVPKRYRAWGTVDTHTPLPAGVHLRPLPPRTMPGPPVPHAISPARGSSVQYPGPTRCPFHGILYCLGTSFPASCSPPACVLALAVLRQAGTSHRRALSRLPALRAFHLVDRIRTPLSS